MPAKSILDWAKMFEDATIRRVGKTDIGDVTISTVFVGLFNNNFETMAFRNTKTVDVVYSATWKEAEAAHALVCGRAKKGEYSDPPNL